MEKSVEVKPINEEYSTSQTILWPWSQVCSLSLTVDFCEPWKAFTINLKIVHKVQLYWC